MDIIVGLKGTACTDVERSDTAASVGSGSLLVYATPCMVAMMEGAACEALDGHLPDGKTSVGIELSIMHTSATPVGMAVRAEAEITFIDGNTITFFVAAFDEVGKIGEGTHKRAIVNTQKFLEKAYEKL